MINRIKTNKLHKIVFVPNASNKLASFFFSLKNMTVFILHKFIVIHIRYEIMSHIKLRVK